MKLQLLLFVIVVVCLSNSCRKNDVPSPPAKVPPGTTGVYVLNDGLNDTSSLSYFDLVTKTTTADRYIAVNGKPIGSRANDIEIYGSKMYVTVTFSGVLDIVDVSTGKLLKQDSLVNPQIGTAPSVYSKEPRDIAFYNGNAYVSCHDGTIAIIDTVTLSVQSMINLPPATQEGIAIANNKLYVANSGLGRGNTVTVIDLATATVIKNITVLPNPTNLAADDHGNMYVMSAWTDDWQEFYVSTGGMTIIDDKTDTVKTSAVAVKGSLSVPIAIAGDQVYYSTDRNNVAVYDAKAQSLVTSSFVTDTTFIKGVSSICINPVTGEVYIADAKDGMFGYDKGDVNVYDKTGKLEYSFGVDVNPVKVQFIP